MKPKRKQSNIPKLNYELGLIKKGHKNIAGLDEVGRGALAGPVVAAACILNHEKRIYKIRDSKLLSPSKRKELARKIKRQAKCWAIGFAKHSEIEKVGIQQATFMSFSRALSKLEKEIDFILVDAFRIPHCKTRQKNIIKGDRVCVSIAAASILAKVYRDNLMEKLSKKYPGYGFEKHKGYGTKQHLKCLEKLGPCKIHRRNFKPVKKILIPKRSEA